MPELSLLGRSPAELTALFNHYLVVAKVRERLAVNKQGLHRFHTEMLNKVEGEDQYRVEVSNRFSALDDLDTEVDISSAWEMIGKNIKFSVKKSPKLF
jgi:hypothetical protein